MYLKTITDIIGFLSSLVTIKDEGIGDLRFFRRLSKKRTIDLKNWDSDDPAVQRLVDAFKTQVRERYGERVFSEDEIREIADLFLDRGDFLGVSFLDRKKTKRYIKDILSRYNAYVESLMTPGEKVLSHKLDSKSDEIKRYLDEAKHEENINKLRIAVKECKSIDLGNIDSLINGEYAIDRSGIIEHIRQNAGSIISIQGHAGHGKSVLAKCLVFDKDFVLYVRADRLNRHNSIDDIWGIDLADAVSDFTVPRLYLFVDALEYIADCVNGNGLNLLEKLFWFTQNNKNTTLITTCRTEDRNAFLKLYSKYPVFSYNLNGLSSGEIEKIGKKYPIIFEMSQKRGYINLLSSPFYINLIVSRITDNKRITSETAFRDYIWDEVVCLESKCHSYGVDKKEIGDAVKHIVIKRAKEFSVGIVRDEVNANILNILLSEGIIQENYGCIRLRYDIFEDIVFEHLFDSYYRECKGDLVLFCASIENLGRSAYRRYQIWISYKLALEDTSDRILYNIIFNNSVSDKLRNQTYIGIVKSDYCQFFFEQYFDELCSDGKLNKLIHMINLYSFDAEYEPSFMPLYNLKVIPTGVARGVLIRLLDKNWKNDGSSGSEKLAVIYLCDGYSRQKNIISHVRKDDDEHETRIAAANLTNRFFKNPDNLFILHIIYRLADVEKDMISSLFDRLIESYNDKDRNNRKCAKTIIQETLMRPDDRLVSEFSVGLCRLADCFWLINSEDCSGEGISSYDTYDEMSKYGLSQNAAYNSYRSGILDYSFFYKVLLFDFSTGLDWCIKFVNHVVESYVKSNDSYSDIGLVRIWFVEEDKTKEYYGSPRLWMSSVTEQSLPTVIGDILFTLKRVIIKIVENKINKGDYNHAYLLRIRDVLYEKSNNIALLAVIEAIGMHFLDAFPGYALDLCSSLELLYLDTRRVVTCTRTPEIELMKKQILKTMNMPFLDMERYISDPKCNYTLQEYAIRSQVKDESLMKKANRICDYLYDGLDADDDEYQIDRLQVEKMDYRMYRMREVTGGIEAVFSNGKEQINMDSEELRNNGKKIASENEEINKMKSEYELAKEIPSRLKDSTLNQKEREDLCKFWIEGIERLFKNGSFLGDNSEVGVLFAQIETTMSDVIKLRLLSLMLECLSYTGCHGIILEIKRRVIAYLRENKAQAEQFFFALIESAKYDSEDINTVVEKYLLHREKLDTSDIQYELYDPLRLCRVCSCGLSLENDIFYSVVKHIIESFDDMDNAYDTYHQRMHDYYSLRMDIVEFLREEVLVSDRTIDIVLETGGFLNEGSVGALNSELYEDVFSHLSVIYFDAYSDGKLRKRIENRIRYLENKIALVEDSKKKIRCYKVLFLAPSRYISDLSQLKTSFSLADKRFLGEQLSKYGKYYPKDAVRTIYIFHMEELLPEILPSLDDVLSNASEDTYNDFVSDTNSLFILELIISHAFLKYSDEIKSDVKLTFAFEHILEIMIGWENAKAAFVLDEFRLH